MASTYTPIATYTLPSNGTTYTFSSIPSTYTDLVIIGNIAQTATGQWVGLRFNGDTNSNYSDTVLEGWGASSIGSARESNLSRVQMVYQGGTDSTYGTIKWDIQNYSNVVTYKTVLGRWNYAGNAVTAGVSLWRSTSAINSVTVFSSGTMTAGSTITLYGIKAA